MWQLTLRFFLGIFAAALFTNAAAVYLFHDVDADRVGKLNLAFWELTLEFLAFGLALAVIFFLTTWSGSLVLRLRDVPLNLKLAFILGVVVTVLQYPAEFAARVATGGSADAFQLAYLLSSPVFCGAIVLMNRYKRRATMIARSTYP
jgi:hypothetical protein